jgi:hypothetical protein
LVVEWYLINESFKEPCRLNPLKTIGWSRLVGDKRIDKPLRAKKAKQFAFS